LFNRAERLISFRNLKPKKKEGFLKIISLFSFIGIMLGVATLIIVMSVMNGFSKDLTQKILGLNPHVIVEPNSQKISLKLMNILKKEYDQASFERSVNGEGIILNNKKTKGVLIKGVKKKYLTNFLKDGKLVKGVKDDFKIGSVIIGAELAFNLDLGINDKINLMSSSLIETPFGSLPKQENFQIIGIFNSGFYEFDQNLIFLHLDDAKSILNKSDQDINLEIYLPKPLLANDVKNFIQNLDNGVFTYSWMDLNKSLFSALKVERNVMFIILTLIIIVAAFNIISGLTILIKNKTKEIAILKTLGLSDKSIKKSFFLTGLIIGLLATIFGTILGITFSFYIEEIRIFLSSFFKIEIFPQDVYFLEKMPSEIDILSVSLIFFFSLIITSIASFFPALAISKMKPSEALKYD
tara:strand:+ start:11767 stop:12996 length:1230 start_codon:yes stop_codon:yes gene_type:complete